MGLTDFWTQADGIGKFVAYLLLAMSIASWLIIFWKGALLARAGKRFRTAKAEPLMRWMLVAPPSRSRKLR
jgi:biopolymer transport protein ExbB/TolQ